jgi:Asp-tRNA(Asn)/Glu-tRNA(Gln) amidotransferase B subunit
MEGHAYRFLAEPNLPRLRIEPEWLAQASAAARPVSTLRHSRYIDDHGFSPGFALHIVVGWRISGKSIIKTIN